MRRLPVLVVAFIVLAGLLTAAPSTTLARFTRTRTSDATLGTGSILPPTGLSASVSGTTVTLTWTPTTSTVVTGYTVRRSTTSGSGYTTIATVTPRSATTATDSPGTGTFYYVLRSQFQNWDSVASNEATAVAGSVATGYKNCTSNAPDAGGDGNGYQTNAGNACALDNTRARDINSGTTTSLSCTDPGQDSHRYWGYAFGLPGSISAVQGIQVEPTIEVNNNGGSSLICVQLSWDGGTSWTATRQVNVTNTLTTSTLGSATDAWGHTWTLAQLDTTNFRVRIIDVSSMNGKDFDLDAIRVQVNYTP